MTPNIFKHVIIIINPLSTHIKTAQQRVEAVTKLFPKRRVHVLRLKKDVSIEQLLASRADILGPDTLLGIAGGDGTINSVIAYLLYGDLSTRARRTVLLPLWGGNANDLAHMLNGPAIRSVLPTIIENGSVVEIKPLCCELTAPNGETTRLTASSYVSFGALGMAARRYNSLLHRNSSWHKVPGGRLVRDSFVTLAVLAKATRFGIEEAGQQVHIYERIFINGSRIGTLPLPLKLTDDAYYRLTVKDNLWSMIGMYVRELVRRPKAELSNDEVVFTCRDTAWGQADGEAFRLEPGTRVRVYRSPKPFFALSTKLH